MVGFTWQTGTSAWGIMCLYEGILGLKRGFYGLTVSPAFPPEWKHVEAERIFRGNKLYITYENVGNKEISLVVDGKEIKGNKVPLFEDEKEHHILVRL